MLDRPAFSKLVRSPPRHRKLAIRRPHAHAEGVAAFELVLQVLGGVSLDAADPRQIHRATFVVLDAAAIAAQDNSDSVGDIADLAVDDQAVVFDVIAQWCRHVIGSIEHT